MDGGSVYSSSLCSRLVVQVVFVLRATVARLRVWVAAVFSDGPVACEATLDPAAPDEVALLHTLCPVDCVVATVAARGAAGIAPVGVFVAEAVPHTRGPLHVISHTEIWRGIHVDNVVVIELGGKLIYVDYL